MSVSYMLTGGEFPAPISPPTPAIGNGSTGPWSTGMQTIGTAAKMDQYAYAFGVVQAQYGAGGYAVIGPGLQISSVSGLNVEVSGGIAQLDGLYEFINSGTPVGAQILLATSYTLLDNATNFVWLTQTGTTVGLTWNTTPGSPPANAKLCLGNVICNSGAITGVDYSGRCFLVGSSVTRQTGDVGTPADSPPSGWRGDTITQAGVYYWNSLQHQPQGVPAVDFSISTTLALTNLNTGVYSITPTSSAQTVKLPGNPNAGDSLIIANASLAGGYNLNIYDSTGTVLVAANVGPGQYVNTGPAVPGGASTNPMYPNTLPVQGGRTAGTIDASSAATPATGTSLTWPHTCAAGATGLTIPVCVNGALGLGISGVTYDGVSASVIAGSSDSSGSAQTVQYFLASPTAGTHNIVVSFTGVETAAAFGVSTFNTRATPGATTPASGNSALPSTAVAGSVGDIVIDTCVALAALTSNTTLLQSANISTMYCAVSWAPGASSRTMSYSATSGLWCISATDFQAV